MPKQKKTRQPKQSDRKVTWTRHRTCPTYEEATAIRDSLLAEGADLVKIHLKKAGYVVKTGVPYMAKEE